MDSKYFVGVPELDAQHDEIIGMVNSLRTMSSNCCQHHLIRPALRDLYDSSVVHFALEDKFMKTVAYPDQLQHRKAHNDILNLLESHLADSRTSSDYQYACKIIARRLLEHIVVNDIKVADSVKQFLDDYQARILKGSYRFHGHSGRQGDDFPGYGVGLKKSK